MYLLLIITDKATDREIPYGLNDVSDQGTFDREVTAALAAAPSDIVEDYHLHVFTGDEADEKQANEWLANFALNQAG